MTSADDHDRAMEAAREALAPHRGLSPAQVVDRVRGEDPVAGAVLDAASRVPSGNEVERGRRRIPRWVAAAAVAAAVTAVALVLTLSGQTPSGVAQAEQILRDVQAVAAAPAGQGISTFSLRMVTAGPSLTVVDGLSVLPNPEADRGETRWTVWDQEPDLRRAEGEFWTPEGELRLSITAVWDGTNWWLDVTLSRDGSRTVRVYRQEDLPATAGGLAVLPIEGPRATGLTALLAGVAHCYRGEVVGAEVIAGRAAHVIDLGRSRCAGTLDVDPHGVSGAADRFVWVDVETAFVLKDELHDAAGNVIAGTTRLITEIEYNAPIDAERFQFDVPAGVSISDCRDVECD